MKGFPFEYRIDVTTVIPMYPKNYLDHICKLCMVYSETIDRAHWNATWSTEYIKTIEAL